MAAVIAFGSRVELLSKIQVPGLVIHGADDPLIPLAAGEDTASSIPGCKLVVIPGMGHNIPDGVVPILADIIVKFCRKVVR
jgi:pimeloyl-ACP methyl ester carboxylesterase